MALVHVVLLVFLIAGVGANDDACNAIDMGVSDTVRSVQKSTVQIGISWFSDPDRD